MLQCEQTLVLEMSIGQDMGRWFLNVPVLWGYIPQIFNKVIKIMVAKYIWWVLEMVCSVIVAADELSSSQTNSYYWMAYLKVAPDYALLLCHVPVYILLSLLSYPPNPLLLSSCTHAWTAWDIYCNVCMWGGGHY